MSTEKDSCPACGALPCDWVDDPHQSRDAILLALADLRRVAGCDEKPMLSELPGVIGNRLHKAGSVLAALCHLTDNPPTSTFFGKDLAEWRHRGRLWLLSEPATGSGATQGSPALEDVAAERRRQIEVEGWTPQHDDEHAPGVLADAGAAYALYAMSTGVAQELRAAVRPGFWPWSAEWWRPQGGRRDLIRAAALLVAEIERLDRDALAKAVKR